MRKPDLGAMIICTQQTTIILNGTRRKKMKHKKELLLSVFLKEQSVDTLTKMMIGYVLNMPKGDKFYYEKVNVVIEFMEQCLPLHPGAFASYFKILNLMPATMSRKIPEGMNEFIDTNWNEIEKYYEETLPEKFRPKKIITSDKRIVDATGTPIASEVVIPKLQLV